MADNPFYSVSTQQLSLSGEQAVLHWQQMETRDYVNALILNDAEQAMILEEYKHGSGWSSWQVLGGFLQEGEDPLTAVKRELLNETGYTSNTWYYLGSYVGKANHHVGVGHFFCARNAQKVTQPTHQHPEEYQLKWVPLRDLRLALLDGRIAVVSYAVTVALTMLTLEARK